MKPIENIKKCVSKMMDDKNVVVVNILFLYMGLIMLGTFYDTYGHNADEQPSKIIKEHEAISETTGENFGTVVAASKEMDGHCEYRACNKTTKICDWYDNNNNECNGMNKGDWVAKVNNRTYKGISLCSETAGKFAEIGNPSQTPGAYCWCKSGKHWVGDLFLNSSSYCLNNGCAGNCAHGVLYSPKFRFKMMNVYRQHAK